MGVKEEPRSHQSSEARWDVLCRADLRLTNDRAAALGCGLRRMMSLLAAVATLSGCAITVESKAVSDYAGIPKRMLVVGPPYYGGGIDPEVRGMEAGLKQQLGTCGIAVDLSDMGLQAANDVVGRLKGGDLAGRYDAVMRLRPVGSFSIRNYGYTQLNSVKYEALVTEQPSGRAVFRGRFELGVTAQFGTPGNRGRNMAQALVRQLAKDRTIRSCPATVTAS